jgi:hypothetical protein
MTAKPAGTEGWGLAYFATQGFATTGLLKDYEDGTLRNFQIAFPDSGATKAAFAAYVANISPRALIGALELNLTLCG